MGKMVVTLAVLGALLSSASPASATRRVAAGEPVTLRLEMGGMTMVVFPEAIKEIYAYVDPKQYSLEQGGERLLIQPLVPDLRGRLFVIGASNAHYQVSYQVREPADDVVYVISPQQRSQIAAVMKPLGMAEVMRALREGHAIPGQEAVDLAAPALPDQRVQLVGWQGVKVRQLVGLVLSVRNTTAQPLGLDIRYGTPQDPDPGVVRLSHWVMPPGHTVVGVSAEREALSPGETLRIYLVLERRGA